MKTTKRTSSKTAFVKASKRANAKYAAERQMTAREEYDARIARHDREFRDACSTMGFKNTNAAMFEQGRVRVWINDDQTINILVFSGCPGWSPVQYEIPISLYAPAEIAVATLKATLKVTAE